LPISMPLTVTIGALIRVLVASAVSPPCIF
jgi:hypothetical protein